MAEIGAEIAKAKAIQANLARKERNVKMMTNEFAEDLATGLLKLSSKQQDELIKLIDLIKAGEEIIDKTIIHPIGRSNEKRKGGSFGWHKNIFTVFAANLSIDFRNSRVFDFSDGLVFDFKKKEIMALENSKIGDFISNAATS